MLLMLLRKEGREDTVRQIQTTGRAPQVAISLMRSSGASDRLGTRGDGRAVTPAESLFGHGGAARGASVSGRLRATRAIETIACASGHPPPLTSRRGRPRGLERHTVTSARGIELG